MNLVDIIILALALSIDATVATFSCVMNASFRNYKEMIYKSLVVCFIMGFFQGLMPIFGAFFAEGLDVLIEPFSKWIIFGIFFYLGISFIVNSFKKAKLIKKVNLKKVVLLAIATSLDAFSAGVPIYLELKSILFPAILIGVVTFINSMIGFYTGIYSKRIQPKYLLRFSGLILLFLAIKVFN